MKHVDSKTAKLTSNAKRQTKYNALESAIKISDGEQKNIVGALAKGVRMPGGLSGSSVSYKPHKL